MPLRVSDTRTVSVKDTLVAASEHLDRRVIRIITIEREYGSGAAQIAENLLSDWGGNFGTNCSHKRSPASRTVRDPQLRNVRSAGTRSTTVCSSRLRLGVRRAVLALR